MSNWSCGQCGDGNVPNRFRVFGSCYKCAAERSIDKRNRRITALKVELLIVQKSQEAETERAEELGSRLSTAEAERDAAVEAEREACAKIADEHAQKYNTLIEAGKGKWPKPGYVQDDTWLEWAAFNRGAKRVASAIRARSIVANAGRTEGTASPPKPQEPEA